MRGSIVKPPFLALRTRMKLNVGSRTAKVFMSTTSVHKIPFPICPSRDPTKPNLPHPLINMNHSRTQPSSQPNPESPLSLTIHKPHIPPTSLFALHPLHSPPRKCMPFHNPKTRNPQKTGELVIVIIISSVFGPMNKPLGQDLFTRS